MHSAVDLGVRNTADLEWEGDILGDGHMADQLIILKDNADAATIELHHRRRYFAQIHTVHFHAAFRDCFGARQKMEQCRLSRAALSRDADELSRIDLHRHITKNRGRAKCFCYPLEGGSWQTV